MTEKETGPKKPQPHKMSRKRKLIAGALLVTTAATGGVGAAFWISSHGKEHTKYHRSLPLYATNDTYQDYNMISDTRLLREAWGAVQRTIPGEIGYMDAHAPKMGEPLTYLVYTQVDKKLELDNGVRDIKHEHYYKATVQCEDSMGLACKVVDAQETEAKDYRPLEVVAQEAVNNALPGHNVQLQITDPARQVVIFEDVSSGTPKLVKALCTKPLKYSCAVG